ncbi:MAG TPA: class I SAM-dependent methyltransferase [Candidatus Dormibacteraeota bacterium]|nr:class I SAM-dependent methyltransferase [Candidatus Dormibacteraeota bacterium]
MSFDFEQFKVRIRWMWSQGDYTSLAEVLAPHSEALAEACSITPGELVLDVAAGTGNFALAAARRGAIVTATDITPNMVELGRARTAAVENITWSEADAEQLPFTEGTYDLVASVFGAMFAPQPQLVAAEMFRVAKPGGRVAMANYSPGGFLGRMADLMAAFSASPAFELPSPFLWGDENEARQRFAGLASSLQVRHRTLHFEGDSVEGFVRFWENTNAPLSALKSMLPPEVYQQALNKIALLVEEMNESREERVKVSSPYILVLARKR